MWYVLAPPRSDPHHAHPQSPPPHPSHPIPHPPPLQPQIAVTVFNYNDAVDDLEEDMEDEEKEDIDEDAESNMNKTFVICTLTAGKVDQCSTDLLFSEVVEIRLLRGVYEQGWEGG